MEYLARIWSGSIVAGLEWHSQNQRMWKDWVLPEVPLPGEKGYWAPSWSWAPLSGSMRSLGYQVGLRDVAEAIDWGVKQKNKDNPFGEVVDAWVKLRAPVFQVNVAEAGTYSNDWTQWTENNLFGHYAWLHQHQGKSEGARDRPRGKDLSGVAIARMLRDDDPEWTVLYDALLVGRHQGGVVRCRRLRLMTFWPHKDPGYLPLS
jgi:hypothetical protein